MNNVVEYLTKLTDFQLEALYEQLTRDAAPSSTKQELTRLVKKERDAR